MRATTKAKLTSFCASLGRLKLGKKFKYAILSGGEYDRILFMVSEPTVIYLPTVGHYLTSPKYFTMDVALLEQEVPKLEDWEMQALVFYRNKRGTWMWKLSEAYLEAMNNEC